MKAMVEERLRRALAQQAETTTISPDGWRRIQNRRAGAARRPALLRWTVQAPAVAVVVLVLIFVTLAGDGGDGALRVTGDAGRIYLEPTGVEPRFRFAGAGSPGSEPWTFRAYGRRGADGVTLDASVVVAVPEGGLLEGVTFLPEPLRAAGHDVRVAGDGFGRQFLYWTQADGRTVGVMSHKLSQAELVGVAESLLSGDAATADPVLPAGFAAVDSGRIAGGTAVAMQTWQADDGDNFTLSVADEPGATFDRVAWSMAGGRVTSVRGTTAIYRPGFTGYLGWIERPGTVVTLVGNGLTEQELVAVADGLRPIEEAQWRQMVNTPRGSSDAGPPRRELGPPPSIDPPPGGVVHPNAWLAVVPVIGSEAPPCRPIQELWLAEVRAGQEVACYKISGPALNAGDVASATVRQDRTTGTWTVEFILTEAGSARFSALFRDVGAGGQYAIVVDGKLVSAERFEAPPSGKGVITGLDEPTARSLAGRLTR